MTHSIFRRFAIVVALSATFAVVVPATISALSTAQVEGALENGVQTAVNWDQGCRSYLSNYPNGNHSLAITAIDEAGATKTVSTQINLVSEDKTPPVFRKEQSRVEKTED